MINNNKKDDLLIEIGTEDLPPKDLLSTAISFRDIICNRLRHFGLIFSKSNYFATARRIAILINELPKKKGEFIQEKRGPKLEIAFDSEGKPTKATEGFAKSCGVEISKLEKRETEEGSWLIYREIKPTIETSDVLPNIIKESINLLPIQKRMRWGNGNYEFIRPVRWLLILFGNKIIKLDIMGIQSDRITYGHRFQSKNLISIKSPLTYIEQLSSEGSVIADFNERRKIIIQQINSISSNLGGIALTSQSLIDEVTALVELPTAIWGNFNSIFLEIPKEILINTMHNQQKCFPVIKEDNSTLLPYFITITNIKVNDFKEIIIGNERVIHSRFSDAKFFWHEDAKYPLYSYRNKLKEVLFQSQLGSLADKTDRLVVLASFISTRISSNTNWAIRAAEICKCDLLTQMVQEFPNLQGIIGKYYAINDHEPYEVAQAQEEQYLPKFSGDYIPDTLTGCTLSLSDKFDNLVGFFIINEKPSGTKDPFALRRNALGIIRILIEKKISINLDEIIDYSVTTFKNNNKLIINSKLVSKNLINFIMDRLRNYYNHQGISSDIFDSILECRENNLFLFEQKIKSINNLIKSNNFLDLINSCKRINNIIGNTSNIIESKKFDKSLLSDSAEINLFTKYNEILETVGYLTKHLLFSELLKQLVSIVPYVDLFFKNVLVFTSDQNLKNNRLLLLIGVRDIFLKIADFSKINVTNT